MFLFQFGTGYLNMNVSQRAAYDVEEKRLEMEKLRGKTDRARTRQLAHESNQLRIR